MNKVITIGCLVLALIGMLGAGMIAVGAVTSTAHAPATIGYGSQPAAFCDIAFPRCGGSDPNGGP